MFHFVRILLHKRDYLQKPIVSIFTSGYRPKAFETLPDHAIRSSLSHELIKSIPRS